LLGSEVKTLRFSEPVEDSAGRSLVNSSAYGYYASACFIAVIGKSDKELDESWVTDGLAGEFEWLTKKRSQDRLEEYGILKVIEAWK
jgi:hypothetical protein